MSTPGVYPMTRLPDPKHTGQSEYRAIRDVLDTAEGDTELMLAILDQFTEWAEAIRTDVRAFSAPGCDGCGEVETGTVKEYAVRFGPSSDAVGDWEAVHYCAECAELARGNHNGETWACVEVSP